MNDGAVCLTDRGADDVVGAAEGCEGGYRFAAFGSNNRDLRTLSVLWEFIREGNGTNNE
jgi:hypothetical protein